VPCYTPLKAYRGEGGKVCFTSAGQNRGYSDRPFELACGQCRGCRLERSRQWALRCVHESMMHTRNCFVTLTYDVDHLPANGSLDVSHFQKFAKRLRKEQSFRYFHCGEYGDETARPHYHALLFGADFSDDQVLVSKKRGNALYTSPRLSRLWTHGYVTVGELTWQSAAYCARYIMKKRGGPQAAAHYRGRKPEYTTMSRRPGIGASWIQKYHSDVYPHDEVVHDGQKFRPPRFYDMTLDEDVLVEYKEKRRLAALAHSKDLTPERLRVREKCQEAREKLLPRNL